MLPIAVLVALAAGWLRWLASERDLNAYSADIAVTTALAFALVAALAFWGGWRLKREATARPDPGRTELYRMIARNLPSGAVFVFDRELRYLLVEGRGLDEVGLTPVTLEGRTIWEALEPEECQMIEPAYRAALAGETTSAEMPFRDQTYLVTIAPIRDADEAIAGGLVLTQKITEQKRLEDQLNQALKMEAVGQLAAGVAHDFNNLLVGIRGYGELLDSRPQDSRAAAWVEQILKASDQAATLTRQLLAFSRKQVVEPRIVNLNELVLETKELLDRLLGDRVEIELALDPELGTVKADPGQLNQILVNLAVNARDAMAPGGRLTIRTANASLDDPSRLDVSEGDEDYVLLSVADTGTGMDEETRSRIFEPFYTTKAKQNGTGLGLSTVYGIVTQAGGHIRVESEPGRGTTFEVHLPLSGEREPLADPADERASMPAPARILVVDDNERVRDIVAAMLHEYGYEPDLAADAAEAVELARRSRYDLLVTDLSLPDLDGCELADRMLESHPGLSVLYISGFADRVIAHDPTLLASFLPKPFTMAQLATAVGAALERRPAHTAGASRAR